MNSELARQPNPVEQARNLLRIIFKYEQARDPRGTDTGSLERMLGHLHNIEKSVTASMQDHVNASKRLRDFAETLERMRERLANGPHQDQGDQIGALIMLLRKASTELGSFGRAAGLGQLRAEAPRGLKKKAPPRRGRRRQVSRVRQLNGASAACSCRRCSRPPSGRLPGSPWCRSDSGCRRIHGSPPGARRSARSRGMGAPRS